MLKYGANVEGSGDLQEWYLRVVNERVNQHFYDINQHAKLQWLTCTTVSPGMGNQRHYWLSVPKQTSNARAEKFLAEQYPLLSDEEIELMAKINTKQQLTELARDLGYSDKDIAAKL
jgi:hypothetical protein